MRRAEDGVLSATALGTSRARLDLRGDAVTWIVGDVTEHQFDRVYWVWHGRAVLHFLLDGTRRAPRRLHHPEAAVLVYIIRKRRYSCFFGTEFEILLKGLGADTLILIGGHTDVCVHYTFVDGHQHDYFCRVVEDCVAGSSLDAHESALRAMEYLQTGARRSSTDVIDAFQAYKRRPLPR